MGRSQGAAVDAIAKFTAPIRGLPLRLTTWTLVCGVCALPSLVFASSFAKASGPAMLCGVAVFVFAYTIATGTTGFARLWGIRLIKRTLLVGLVTRVLMALLFPFGWLPDFVCGALSISLFRTDAFDLDEIGFARTLAITLIQGLAIHVQLLAYMALVYTLMRIRERQDLRDGFCVQCGYDLRGTPTRCPECGLVVRNDPLTQRPEAEPKPGP